MSADSELDERVRIHVYQAALATGRPPLVRAVSAALGLEAHIVAGTLARLQDRRVLVLQPSGEILMAMPFSAVPTPFLVETGPLHAFGNCGWDALGIAAMLEGPATVRASCAESGQALAIDIRDGQASGPPLVLHFGLPVRQWWNSVVFT